MTLAFLVIAATVIGGEVGPFISWDDVTADEAHTPGSAEFYDSVAEMDVYDNGIVYRNGTVVTNVPFPAVVASMDDDCDYGWCYDFSQSIGPGETFDDGDKRRKRIRMNQFDLSWISHSNHGARVRYRAYGTNWVTKAIHPPVMLPVSRRLDEETRAALLASYEAYFERLYWGSKGDVNEWNESNWGRKTPGPGFKFNFAVNQYYTCTNHFDYAYPTNDVRLLEHTNFVALAAAVKRMFPTGVIYPDIHITPAHPAWLYRDTWLLRDCMRGMWWSSSILPRIEPQPLGGGSAETYTPHGRDFTLMPVTKDWISDSEAMDESEMKWACRSFTLDVFKSGGGFAGKPSDMNFPCCHVMYMADSAVDSHVQLRTVPTWETDDTLRHYLTNAFPYAAMESVNPTNAMNKYCASFNNDSHRLSPSAYAWLNHVLTVMDRTITIPALPVVRYHHNWTHVDRSGTYTDGGVPSGYWNDSDGCYYVDYGSGQKTLNATGYTNSINRIDWGKHAYCELSVTDLDRRDSSVDIPQTISSEIGQLTVGYDFFHYLCTETGWDYLLISAMRIDDTGHLGVTCDETDEQGRRTWSDPKEVVVPTTCFRPETDPYAPPLTASAHRGYSFVLSDRQTPQDIQIQPPTDAGDRVREAKYALARRRQRGSGVSPLVKEWKFDEEHDYTRGTWASQMRSEAAKVKADLDEVAMDFYGVDYSNPDEFAPLPQSVIATVTGEFKYRPDSYELTSTIPYPQLSYYTKERYRLDFFVPEYGIDVTNLTATVSNLHVRAETAAFVKEEVAPDGWRWVTEAYTNELSRETLSVDVTTNEEVVTAISYGVTNLVEKYRWAEDVYPDVERREWTNHLSQSSQTAIIESDHYGVQTNVVVYYDDHLVVTNTETNVTALAYLTTATNVASQTECGPTEFKEWTDKYPYPYPYGEIRDDYTFLVDKYIWNGNGMAYWVIYDPMTGDMITLEGVAYPYPIGTGHATLRLESEEPVSLTIDWPEMQTSPFDAREAFHSIHRVDWNWKSMHDKQE